jgi:cytochrome c biogenesis protein CcmG/thiol:disulfide interchange protein DsbE
VNAPNESAPPGGEAPQDPPLPTRFGLLTLVSLAVVGIGVAVAAVLSGGNDAAPTSTGAVGLTGSPAPDFTVPLLAGGDFSLAEHIASDGRPLILNLWASWCIPCRDELPEFDRVAAEHPEVAFLGVAVEDQEAAAREFAEEVGVSFPLGFDDSGNVSTAYQTFGLPVTVAIASDGSVARQITSRVPEEQLLELLEELDG